MNKMKSDSDKTTKSKKKKSSGVQKLNLKSNKELLAKLPNSRVVQRQLVYIIGLSPRLANKTVNTLTTFCLDFRKSRIYGAIWKYSKSSC
jgi:hypothetical protein